MDANGLRRAWNEFFAARQHTLVTSASLIPTHPTAPMFTNSGMMQFVPYFLGEEPVPYAPPRASSIHSCSASSSETWTVTHNRSGSRPQGPVRRSHAQRIASRLK